MFRPLFVPVDVEGIKQREVEERQARLVELWRWYSMPWLTQMSHDDLVLVRAITRALGFA